MSKNNQSFNLLFRLVFSVSAGQFFNPNDTATRLSVQQGLNRTVNHAFLCVADQTLTNCTRISTGRRKRQTCNSGYAVVLVSNIVEVGSIYRTIDFQTYFLQVITADGRRFRVDYIVQNLCSGSTLMTPVQVQTAIETLSQAVVTNLFGFNADGSFVRSDASTVNTATAATDQKLWLIGATIGPVAFILFLSFVCCFLHYKCRPRPQNRNFKRIPPTAPGETPIVPTEPVFFIDSSHQCNNETNTDFLPYSQAVKATTKDSETERSAIGAIAHPSPLRIPISDSPTSVHQLVEKESARSMTDRSSATFKLDDVPIDEFRRQNEVERWRNKLRLHDKFQVNKTKSLRVSF